jgi:hypothetical protein
MDKSDFDTWINTNYKNRRNEAIWYVIW